MFGDEGHLDVDLGELGLTVGAQVFVTEATRDLVIALDAANLRELLEELRRLGQRIEVTGIGARWHDEVARTLGGGLAENRGLDLDEEALMQGVANRPGDGVAQTQGLGNGRASHVEIAPLHARELVGVDIVVEREGRRGRLVEDRALVHDHVDLARGQIGIGSVFGALAHETGNLDGPLGTHPLAQLEAILGGIGIENDLRNARTVAQIDEDETAVVTPAGNPAGKRHRLADILATQLATGMRVHGVLVCKILRHCMPSFIMRSAIDSGGPRLSLSQGSYYETSDKPARGAFRQAYLEQTRHILGNGIE